MFAETRIGASQTTSHGTAALTRRMRIRARGQRAIRDRARERSTAYAAAPQRARSSRSAPMTAIQTTGGNDVTALRDCESFCCNAPQPPARTSHVGLQRHRRSDRRAPSCRDERRDQRDEEQRRGHDGKRRHVARPHVVEQRRQQSPPHGAVTLCQDSRQSRATRCQRRPPRAGAARARRHSPAWSSRPEIGRSSGDVLSFRGCSAEYAAASRHPPARRAHMALRRFGPSLARRAGAAESVRGGCVRPARWLPASSLAAGQSRWWA